MTELTKFERLALEYLATVKTAYPSAIGFHLLKHSNTERTRQSAQGAALFAGKFIRALHKRGLVSHYPEWNITAAGRKALEHG